MNDTSRVIRQIDELGRIVLPAEARRAMDWGEKTLVEIRINSAEHEIVIRQHMFSCAYCGSVENLKEFRKKHICTTCQKAISAL